MKIRWNPTSISTALLSLCLATFIPGGLRLASTWRNLYFERQQNLAAPIGFCSLGFAIIGLIILWTGYRKRERWAWFALFILLLFHTFPLTVMPLFLYARDPGFAWAQFFNGMREGFMPAVWLAEGVVTFLVMLVALLMPVKTFSLRHANQRSCKSKGYPVKLPCHRDAS